MYKILTQIHLNYKNLKRLRLIKRQQLPTVSIVLHVQTKEMTSGFRNKM